MREIRTYGSVGRGEKPPYPIGERVSGSCRGHLWCLSSDNQIGGRVTLSSHGHVVTSQPSRRRTAAMDRDAFAGACADPWGGELEGLRAP